MAGWSVLLVGILTFNYGICQTIDPEQPALSLALLHGLDSNTAREGDMVQLQCKAPGGLATGTFEWSYSSSIGQNSPISPGDDGVMIMNGINNGDPTSVLSISQINRNGHGTYWCMFTSEGKETSISLVVNIVFLPVPECYQSHATDSFRILSVLCSTFDESYGNTTLQWKDIATGDNLGEAQSDFYGALFLNVDDIPDGDIYRLQCVATNIAFPGSQTSCDFIPDVMQTTTGLPTTTTPKHTTFQTTGTPTLPERTSPEVETSQHPVILTSDTVTTTNITTTNISSTQQTSESPKLNTSFGTRELIIVSSLGGCVVLILLILGIVTIIRLCRAPRRSKNPDFILSYDTRDIIQTSTPDAYVNDAVDTPEYFVLERMNRSGINSAQAPSDQNDLSTGHQLYTGVIKGKDGNKERKDKIPTVALNLYDSINIDD